MHILKKLNRWFHDLKDTFIHANCMEGKHKWKHYKTRTDRFVYYVRECIHCDRTEIQNNGPIGKGTWKSLMEPFTHEWEREEFDKSIRDREK